MINRLSNATRKRLSKRFLHVINIYNRKKGFICPHKHDVVYQGSLKDRSMFAPSTKLIANLSEFVFQTRHEFYYSQCFANYQLNSE